MKYETLDEILEAYEKNEFEFVILGTSVRRITKLERKSGKTYLDITLDKYVGMGQYYYTINEPKYFEFFPTLNEALEVCQGIIYKTLDDPSTVFNNGNITDGMLEAIRDHGLRFNHPKMIKYVMNYIDTQEERRMKLELEHKKVMREIDQVLEEMKIQLREHTNATRKGV